MEFVDQALLLRGVEIDHHIAAEDHVVSPRQKLGFQIVKVELHQISERRLHHVLVRELLSLK